MESHLQSALRSTFDALNEQSQRLDDKQRECDKLRSALARSEEVSNDLNEQLEKTALFANDTIKRVRELEAHTKKQAAELQRRFVEIKNLEDQKQALGFQAVDGWQNMTEIDKNELVQQTLTNLDVHRSRPTR